jgi:argininosuccinate lyase
MKSSMTFIGEGVVALLDNRASMNARQSEGETAKVRTLEQVEILKRWLEGQK